MTTSEITVNRIRYCQVNNQHILQYIHTLIYLKGLSGAKGEIAVHVINKTRWNVDVQDIDNHYIIDIPIATRGGVVFFKQQGNVMLIIDQNNMTTMCFQNTI